MDKTSYRVLTLTVSCMLFLSTTAQRVIAWPCGETTCGPCEECTEDGCECKAGAQCNCPGKSCSGCCKCSGCSCVPDGSKCTGCCRCSGCSCVDDDSKCSGCYIRCDGCACVPCKCWDVGAAISGSITVQNANHCHTNAGTALAHYHFESDFNEAEIAAANRYWDWFFDVNSSGIVRISNATNQRDSLAYAMDGYAGSANYGYWIVPSEDSNKIFTEDCNKDNSVRPPTLAAPDDRLAYEGLAGIYRHTTIVNSTDANEPDEIQWKWQYSGVYRYDNSSAFDRFATPGRDDVKLPAGSAPSGIWDPNYRDSNDADVYYSDIP